MLDVHCTTEKRHDTQIGWQLGRRNVGEIASLAADKGYDWQQLREKLREEGVRPLIKHREFRPIDCAHNARIDGLYTANEHCLRPSSRRSSGRSATRCVPERGTVNFMRSF